MEDEHKVYQLKKDLYGLKQALRVWFCKMESQFKNEGFQKINYDHALFLKNNGNKLLVASFMLIIEYIQEMMNKCIRSSSC